MRLLFSKGNQHEHAGKQQRRGALGGVVALVSEAVTPFTHPHYLISPTSCAVVAHREVPQLRLTNGGLAARHGRCEGYGWIRQQESSDQRAEVGGHATRGGAAAPGGADLDGFDECGSRGVPHKTR